MINHSLILEPDDDIFDDDLEEINNSDGRPDKILIDPSLNNIEYGQKLEELLNELGIDDGELAVSIDMSRDTIGNYKNGTNSRPIKNDIKAKINHALNEAMFYKGYEHMPHDEFGRLFAELWEEFKSDITQEDFAVKAGYGNQSGISQIKSGDLPVYSTKEQYNYLLAFYDLCIRKSHYWFCNRPSKLKFFSRHSETAVKLENLLFGNSSAPDNKENNDDKLSVNVIDTIIEQLITFPIEAQKLILSYPFAFLDSLAAPNFHHSDGSYISAVEFIERFRQLPKAERLRFYDDMQQLNANEKIYNYSYGESNWFLFDMNLHYQNMINSARQRKIADPVLYDNNTSDPIHDNSVDSFRCKKKDKEIDKNKQRHLFEAVINAFDDRCWKNCPTNIITDTIIDDIKYRQNMSPFEWQLWSLYASYVYTFHTDSEIEILFERSKIEQGFSAIADHIVSLPFDEQERICLSPMFFFDSLALCGINSDRESSVIYFKARELFEEYDALSDEEKQKFIEKTAEFREMSSDYAGYPISCDYYDNYKEIPVYGNVQARKKAIMEFLFGFPIYIANETEFYKELAELVIDDISYKLSMSREQWNIWCLFIETVYNMLFDSVKDETALEILHIIIAIVKKY